MFEWICRKLGACPKPTETPFEVKMDEEIRYIKQLQEQRIEELEKVMKTLQEEAESFNSSIVYNIGDKVKSNVIEGLVGNVTAKGAKYVVEHPRFPHLVGGVTTISWINHNGDVSNYSDFPENFQKVEI